MSQAKLLHHLSGLVRTRVVLSLFGIWVVYKEPSIGQWVVTLVGMAIGVSAIDAVRGVGRGRNSE